MSYNNAIPQATDNPSQSQSEILANFQTLDTTITVNHVVMNDADEGKHKFLQMPEQGAAPTTAANEGGLYTKEATSVTNLFFRREGDGDELQLTGTSSLSGNGYTFLPGGLLLQWGAGAGSSGGATITFPVAFSTIYTVVATAQNASSATVAVESIGNASFRAYTSGTSLTVRFMAVGLP